MLTNITFGLLLTAAQQPIEALPAPPYDFSVASEWLTAELPNLDEHVAVILRQDGRELFRFQHGDIDYGTRTRLASFTKTVSAGVVLALIDEGVLAEDERLGDALPLFESNGLGDPTVLDCWAMRHGITAPQDYERLPSLTLAQSVTLIGLQGSQAFPAGTQLGYDGKGMQTVGQIAAQRTGLSWGELARTRIFDACDMPEADYLQFDPNPAVAGGLRSSADETIRYAQMLIDGGLYKGSRVLSPNAVERMFVNETRTLPVYAAPFPATHPFYPYGDQPDYAFGSWILAENPQSQHVEELVGAGAWGSYLWIDRRRGMTATFITDIAPGSQSSMNAALGLFAIARQIVEGAQVRDLAIGSTGGGLTSLSWKRSYGSTQSFVYGSTEPIRDLHGLRKATRLLVTSGSGARVAPYPHYAVTSVFHGFENTALVPGSNSQLASRP